MKEGILSRILYSPVATLGRLELFDEVGHKEHDLFTIERPWMDNEPFKSCIPEGEYDLTKYFSPSRHREVLLLRGDTVAHTQNELDESAGIVRYMVQMHIANLASEVVGCIAPGMGIAHGYNGERYQVTNSASAFSRLMKWFDSVDEDGVVKLHITAEARNVYP